MYSIKEMYEDIVTLADVLEENGIDAFRFPKGVEPEMIEAWERDNDSKLPQGYKEFIALVNGFRYCGTEVFPLERIRLVEVPVEFEGYYSIGSYIGDGSLLLSDKSGNVYYGDHVTGIEKVEFCTFVQDDILRHMKEAFSDNGIEIPDNIHTKNSGNVSFSEDGMKKIMEMVLKYRENK